jgi:hypothetical protein
MPVILPEDAFEAWLDTRGVDAETAAALLTPAPDDLLEAYPISTAVNRVANDDARLIERVDPAGQIQENATSQAQPDSPEPKPAKPKRKKDDDQPSLF